MRMFPYSYTTSKQTRYFLDIKESTSFPCAFSKPQLLLVFNTFCVTGSSVFQKEKNTCVHDTKLSIDDDLQEFQLAFFGNYFKELINFHPVLKSRLTSRWMYCKVNIREKRQTIGFINCSMVGILDRVYRIWHKVPILTVEGKILKKDKTESVIPTFLDSVEFISNSTLVYIFSDSVL
ncbi:hypothetical protein K501DRAFT_266567 [Backusella circina FSU 941]|nr:hypothetical protein K501DRAFT_266567 [Backusella circina FSU 941]